MGWPVATLLGGFLAGFLLALWGWGNVMERNIEKGQMSINGDFYSLVPIAPTHPGEGAE